MLFRSMHMITAALLITLLFLGGWHFWGLTSPETTGWPDAILKIVILMTKTFGVIVFFMMVRWSWPRFRFDQLMSLAWKVMLPLGMLNLAVVAVLSEPAFKEYFDGGSTTFFVVFNMIVAAVACVVTAMLQPLAADNRPRGVENPL